MTPEQQFNRLDALSVSCESCGVSEGIICKSQSGTMRSPHAPRLKKALLNPPKVGERWLCWRAGWGASKVTLSNVDAIPSRLSELRDIRGIDAPCFSTPDVQYRPFVCNLIMRVESRY
jgi:hypothetical protein